MFLSNDSIDFPEKRPLRPGNFQEKKAFDKLGIIRVKIEQEINCRN